MDYGFGKTYRLKDGFTALNGCIQYYKVTFKNVDLVAAAPVDPKNPTDEEIAAYKEAQANFLRALEVLRTYGGQPIITKAEGKVLEFTLEQANVYGHNEPQQVSAKWDGADVETGTAGTPNSFIEDAKAKIEELFKNVKAVDGTTSFEVAEDGVEIKEVLF